MKSNKWQSKPGFDDVTGRYIPLDPDEWIDENEIREIGRKNGENDLPNSENLGTDEIPHKILDWVDARAKACQNDVAQFLTGIASTLNFQTDTTYLQQQLGAAKIQSQDTRLELNNYERKSKSRLVAIEEKLADHRHHYHDFRKQNDLTRPAHYDHQKNAIFVIASIAILEIFLNATLLMDVVPTGLIGSFFQMFLIVAVNIVTGAFLLGTLWRVVNHKKALLRAFAWTGVLITFVALLCFNLLVGHFRETLLADQELSSMISANEVAQAFDPGMGGRVFETFLSAPVGFEHFQSFLLVLVGLSCFVISSWKGYQLDDPYIGYGRIDRSYKSAREEYQEEFEIMMDQIRDIYHSGMNRLQDIRDDLQTRKANYSTQLIVGRQVVNSYTQNLEQYENDLNWLLGAYYTANNNARSSGVLDWPELKLNPKIFDPPIFEPPPEGDLERAYDEIHELIEGTQQEYENIQGSFKPSNDVIRDIGPVVEAR